MKKAQDFRDQSTEELLALSQEMRKEKFVLLNSQQQTKKLEKPHRIPQIRRDIARINTILNARERQVKEQGSTV